MNIAIKIGLMALILACSWTKLAQAQENTATGNLTINAKINAKAKISLDTASITFDDSGIDPDITTVMPANPLTVGITAKVKTGDNTKAILTCVAASAFFDPGHKIPVSTIKWTATGSGYISGIMDYITAQLMASRTGSGLLDGTITPTMDSSWEYPSGDYSVTANFTLIAP